MSFAKKLLEKNLIQIDKHDPDFSELESILKSLKHEQQLTIFVAYKQDIEDDFQNLSFIRIDLNQPFIKKYFHIASSSKKRKIEKFYFKSDILISNQTFYILSEKNYKNKSKKGACHAIQSKLKMPSFIKAWGIKI